MTTTFISRQRSQQTKYRHWLRTVIIVVLDDAYETFKPKRGLVIRSDGTFEVRHLCGRFPHGTWERLCS